MITDTQHASPEACTGLQVPVMGKDGKHRTPVKSALATSMVESTNIQQAIGFNDL